MNVVVFACSYSASLSPPPTFSPTSKVSLMRLNKGLEAGVLLAQGVLAGLTLASMYTMALANSLQSFVAAYEVRMAFSHACLCNYGFQPRVRRASRLRTTSVALGVKVDG